MNAGRVTVRGLVLLVPETQRLATALEALRRTIDESRALVAAAALSRLERDYEALDLRREGLISDAKQLTTDSPQWDRDVLALRVIQFYRDVGEVERLADTRCGWVTNTGAASISL